MDDLQALTDEELVDASLLEQRAFAVLIDRYHSRLQRFVLRISNISSEEAEDIIQDTWIAAYRNLNGFDTKLSFSSWIYRIARNQTISQYRKRSVRPQGNSVELDDELLNTLASDISINHTIDNQLLKEHIGELLADLDEKYRTVLILKYVEDKTYSEIADILKKPEGTVATLLNRAKKRLEKLIATHPTHHHYGHTD